MDSAELLKLKARKDQIKEVMRWVDDAEELAFLVLESKQIDRQIQSEFDERATELEFLFKEGVF